MKIKLTILAVLAILLLPQGVPAQATLTSTTLSAAVTSASATTVVVTSATGFSAGRMLFVEKEAMDITAVSGTTILVVRGASSTRAVTHASGVTVYVGPKDYFTTYERSGSCTSTNELVLPRVNVTNGDVYNCTSSRWVKQVVIQAVTATISNHLVLDTFSDDKQIRINSRNFTQTTGSSMGFQSKPAQSVTSTGSVIGGEISPRVNSGIAIANVIGLHVDAYLRGTAAGTVSGDVRGMQIELVTDDAGTRTISGDVTGLRMRSAFSATTITGNFTAFKIEKPESQTNSQTYDALFNLTGTIPLVWNNAPGTEPSTADGYIKVIVNGATRYIQLYSTAPVD